MQFWLWILIVFQKWANCQLVAIMSRLVECKSVEIAAKRTRLSISTNNHSSHYSTLRILLLSFSSHSSDIATYANLLILLPPTPLFEYDRIVFEYDDQTFIGLLAGWAFDYANFVYFICTSLFARFWNSQFEMTSAAFEGKKLKNSPFECP